MCLGIPGRVVAITDADKLLGVVDIGGVTRAVNLACVVDEEHPVGACVGTWVLVHVGFAMQRINEEEAARTLDLLRQLDEAELRRDGAS